MNLAGPVIVSQEPHPPVAVADSFATDEDVALTLTEAQLLLNDSDRDVGDVLHVNGVNSLFGGIAVMNGSSVVFTPTANFNGMAVFTYQLHDSLFTTTGTVSVAVNPVNDQPFANAGIDRTVGTGTIVSLDGSGSSDIDVGVWYEYPLPSGTLSYLREALEESTIPYTVDLVDLTRTNSDFRESVFKEGKLWNA